MAPGLCAIVTVVIAVLVSALASVLHRSSPVDPLPVDLGPLPSARSGFWAPEFNLQNVERIDIGAEGPEDVVFDKQGRIYTGCANGWVKRIDEDGKVTNFSYTGGRPLGLAIQGDPEVMYLADAKLGLFEISLSDGVPHLIANKDDDEGIPMGYSVDSSDPALSFFVVGYYEYGKKERNGGLGHHKLGDFYRNSLADGVAVTSDGVVYFSDATVKFIFDTHILDLLESRPNGRLLKYDPAKRTVSLVKSNLWFPNGVALSGKEDFVLVCETSRARVLRLWLKGEKEGTWEVFLEGLPGYPDNVKYHDGHFYIGLVAKRTWLTDFLFETSVGAQLRRIVPYVPVQLYDLSASSRTIGRFIVVTEEGQLVKKYEDPTGKLIHVVTGGNRFGDYVYVNSLVAPFLGRIKAAS